MKKQLKFVVLAALAFNFVGCGDSDEDGTSFAGPQGLFQEGLLVEFVTDVTTVETFYTQVDAEVKNIEGYRSIETDTVGDGSNPYLACAELGQISSTAKTSGTGLQHIVGKQAAYITPGDSGAVINGSTLADVLTYRDGWLDVVDPVINPQYYENLACDCFGDPLKVASVNLYYVEFTREDTSSIDDYSKVAVAPVTGVTQTIADYHSFDNASAPSVNESDHLFGWYALEGYLWELELASDAGGVGSGTFPVDLQSASVAQMLPEGAKVGDSWFANNSNIFFSAGYLYSIVAEEPLDVLNQDGKAITIKALHVVRRSTDGFDLLDNKIIETTCFDEVEVSQDSTGTTSSFFNHQKCNKTGWINKADYWFYKNTLVKRIEDGTTVNFSAGGYRQVPDQTERMNTDNCGTNDSNLDSLQDNGNAYFSILSQKHAADPTVADYKPYVEYSVVKSHESWVATVVREDATLKKLYEEEKAAAAAE